MTNSIAFPNMFDGARNRVGVLNGNQSIVNRVRLLLLTNQTEVYNEPDFGGSLIQFIWQYNSGNQKARIRDRIVEQLRMFEPCVSADDTQFSDGLTAEIPVQNDFNSVKMTVGLRTIYGDNTEIHLDNLQEIINKMQGELGGGVNG
jgi:phage baseplate assembly protein W